MKDHDDLTEIIIGCCFEVANTLGIGFLESVYKKSLIVALEGKGLRAEPEKPLQVYFRNKMVGGFFADLVVENCVIVEVKCAQILAPEHQAQLINYLKASQMMDGLLVNFGAKKLEIKRLRHPQKFKQHLSSHNQVRLS